MYKITIISNVVEVLLEEEIIKRAMQCSVAGE